MDIEQQLPGVITAVREKLVVGPQKRSVVLFDGKTASAEPGHYVYRYGIPEGVFMGQVDDGDIISLLIDRRNRGELLRRNGAVWRWSRRRKEMDNSNGQAEINHD